MTVSLAIVAALFAVVLLGPLRDPDQVTAAAVATMSLAALGKFVLLALKAVAFLYLAARRRLSRPRRRAGTAAG